ncbi:MAG: IS200/IS605 family transposase [Planctomycetota bacterium]
MAATLTSIRIHFIFSTKDRHPTIAESFENALYAYIGGICRSHASVLIAAGGTIDHVHLLISLGKTISASELMLKVKRDSSIWVPSQVGGKAWDGWQEGYAAFSIGESGVPALKQYIANQKQHHRTIDFKTEYKAFLKKYGIEFNEDHLW